MKELTLFETTRAHSACHSVEFRLPKVKNVLTVLGTLSAGALSASPRCSSSAHPFKSNFLFRPATDDAIVMSTATAGLRSSAGPRDSRAIKVQTRLFLGSRLARAPGRRTLGRRMCVRARFYLCPSSVPGFGLGLSSRQPPTKVHFT